MRSSWSWRTVTPKPTCSMYSGPKPRWIASHHGPSPSPARSETSTGPVPCFWTAIAGLNLGASFAEPLPESDMIPWAIGLPPCAPPTPTARSESWTSTPPARSPASTRPKTYSATDPIVRAVSSSGPSRRRSAGRRR